MAMSASDGNVGGPGGSGGPSDDGSDDRLQELFSQLFGERAEDIISQMRSQGVDPAQMFGGAQNLPTPATVQAAMAYLRQLIAEGGDDPLNVGVAHDLARQAAVIGGDPTITVAQAREVANAFTAAELWLDVATDLAPSGGPGQAWSRSQWVEETLPTWNKLVSPIAESMANALATVIGDSLPGTEVDLDQLDFAALASGELGGLGSDAADALGDREALDRLGLGALNPAQLMRKLGATAFGMQAGQAAGGLSKEVFGTTDLGLPLVTNSSMALLPTNIAEFADGLDIPLAEVRGYLAVREAAVARLFNQVPWLRPHLLNLLERYAAGISVDLDTLQDSVRDIDPLQPDQLQRMLAGGGLFVVQPTDEQRETLLKLETALALIEGWVDEVTTQATAPHLPHAPQLREMLRRRRAAGGPAEQAFASLVGLDLRPRRSRDAAQLFAELYRADGVAGRDRVWSHPDLLPTAEDLDDPKSYLPREAERATAHDELDAALAQLLADAAIDNSDGGAAGGSDAGGSGATGGSDSVGDLP